MSWWLSFPEGTHEVVRLERRALTSAPIESSWAELGPVVAAALRTIPDLTSGVVTDVRSAEHVPGTTLAIDIVVDGTPTPVREQADALAKAIRTACDARSAETSPYRTVRIVLNVLDACQRRSLYGPAVRVWARHERTNERRAQVAPLFVLAWFLVMVAVLATGRWWAGHGVPEVIVCALGAYRWVDIVSFHARLILSRSAGHNTIAGYERSLILLAVNAAELSLICALWFRAAGADDFIDAWYNGFLAATFTGAPPVSGQLASPAMSVVVPTVATTVAAMLLLLGGAATLISLIGHKFAEHAD